ncbi:DUF262 domain-containing protein [Amycolatopsis sp. NPDC088138]|uniref:DUF262 domain-containing protein n=1 Tax=Amycolatopsis sp. NPDC088138 TaxID=3363938 RepID=UPI00382C7A7A
MNEFDNDRLVSQWNGRQDALVLQYNELALSTLANMVGSGTIDVAPQFQRRDRWNSAKQSALIESFLINLPIPPIYLSEESGGKFSVIDGRQRLTAIRMFFAGDLTLGRTAELPELEGHRYSTLPQELKSALDMRPLRSVTLMRQTDDDIKYIVFHRLNSAGDVLNSQEIRNVIYRGPLNDTIYKLADHSFLRRQLKIESEQSSAFRKMQDVEFVLRFLTLSETWQRFSGDLAPSMDLFMARYREAEPRTLDGFEVRFLRAINGCKSIWGDHAFHRPDGDGWRDQALAGLYDAQMIAMNELSDNEIASLASRSREAIAALRELFKNDEFDKAVRTGTNTPARIQTRIDELINTLRVLLGR